ncbi:hypothetical protein [Microbacterium sp. MPKO10]|nr:hypothetical protein [Microbacterium sp. MPKO10]MCW4458609.1 hypothetical protein [Microbacterium sp. MPKO10]
MGEARPLRRKPRPMYGIPDAVMLREFTVAFGGSSAISRTARAAS